MGSEGSDEPEHMPGLIRASHMHKSMEVKKSSDQTLDWTPLDTQGFFLQLCEGSFRLGDP